MNIIRKQNDFVLPYVLFHIRHDFLLAFRMYNSLLVIVFLFFKFTYFLKFFVWLRWVFIATRGLSLVAVSRGYSSLGCAGFSSRWLLFVAEHGL